MNRSFVRFKRYRNGSQKCIESRPMLDTPMRQYLRFLSAHFGLRDTEQSDHAGKAF